MDIVEYHRKSKLTADESLLQEVGFHDNLGNITDAGKKALWISLEGEYKKEFLALAKAFKSAKDHNGPCKE